MLRGSVVTVLYRITGTLAWLLVGVITARELSVRDLGLYVSTLVVVQAVGTVGASFGSATGYFVSKQGRPESEVGANSLLLSLVAGVTLIAGSCLVVLTIGIDHRSLVILASLGLLPIISRNALGGIALGKGSYWGYNFSVHGPAYVNVCLLFIWAFILDGDTTRGALTAWVISQWASLVIIAAMAPGWMPWLARHRPDWSLIRAIASFGTITGVAGFISYFNYRVDQLMVAGIDGADAAGAYSRAVNLAEGLWLVSTSIAIASYASVGSLNRHDAAVLTATGVRHTLLIVAGGAVVTWIAAPYLIEFLFGERYTGATTSLRILCVGTALFAPQSVLANYFTVQMGRPVLAMSIAAISCAINIGLGFILIPRIGYEGGAWATTISYGAVAGLSAAIFLRNSDARLSDLWRLRRSDIDSYVRLLRRSYGVIRPSSRPDLGETGA